jgi:hypothetical protein
MIVFGILAHDNPECFADLIESVRRFAPDAGILLFDGGTSAAFKECAIGLGVERCRYSKPLVHGKLADFHFGVMRHLHEEQRAYDYLVTMDSDMLLVRSGLETQLDRCLRDSGYMGTNFHLLGDAPFESWQIGQYFQFQWERWASAFDCERPAGCFNPGQVFRREFVEQILQYAKLPELLRRVERSRLPALEEVIFPTLAVSLAANPKSNPGSKAIQLKPHDGEELAGFLADGAVFMVHKVSMNYDAPDRRYLRAARRGEMPEPFRVATNVLKTKRFQPLRTLLQSVRYKYF